VWFSYKRGVIPPFNSGSRELSILCSVWDRVASWEVFALTIKYVSNYELTRAHPEDAGLDICADESVFLMAKSHGAIKTSLHVEIPHGYVGKVEPRSGLSFTYAIETGAGVVDSGYTGSPSASL
jgi:dUTP pyrophosphatase